MCLRLFHRASGKCATNLGGWGAMHHAFLAHAARGQSTLLPVPVRASACMVQCGKHAAPRLLSHNVCKVWRGWIHDAASQPGNRPAGDTGAAHKGLPTRGCPQGAAFLLAVCVHAQRSGLPTETFCILTFGTAPVPPLCRLHRCRLLRCRRTAAAPLRAPPKRCSPARRAMAASTGCTGTQWIRDRGSGGVGGMCRRQTHS